MVTQLVFDTDLIGDDLLALIAAIGSTAVAVKAVTAFGRRYSAMERAVIALKLLDCLGIKSIPVAAGANRPLLRAPRPGCAFCDEPIMNFLNTDLVGSTKKTELYQRIDPRSASQLITEAITAQPGEVSVLCTGPLTNLAVAVVTHPEIAELAKEIVIMGGATWVSGNVSPVAESNIYNDPEAAAIVFDRFPRITMVGLDVTFRTLIDASLFVNLFPKDSELGKLVSEIISSCILAQQERRGLTQMPLHDPLALLVAIEPSLIKTVPCEVKIETNGQYTIGQTVCRPLTAEERVESDRPVVKVATTVDKDRAVELFRDAVLKAIRFAS